MHVAIISHDILSRDGQGRVNVELAQYLLGQGVTVDLFADRVEPTLVEQGATWIPVHPGGRSINLVRVWQFRRLVNRLLDAREKQYDLILACGVVLDRPHTVNVAHFVHGTWVDSPHHPAQQHWGPKKWYYQIYSRLNARWERDVWAQADVVVAVSENVRRDIVNLGVAPERVHVIPNGVDPSEFAPGPSARDRFGLPTDTVLGLFVGDIRSPIKNLDTALRALKDVPELHLAVAGAVEGSPYPSLAATLGVDDRVHFLGFQQDIAALMRSADFFVLPSHQDAFGLVVTEAMASGLPVIVSGNVGASCLVTEKTGVVIDPPSNTDALATAYRRLAADPALRQTMGTAARECAKEYSWTRLGERYLNLFRRMVPQKSPASPSSFSTATVS